MPLVVPRTIWADTAIHVGDPKFRLPASENACPFSFFNLVQRTTSHGGEGESVSPESKASWLVTDTVLLCPVRYAGDDGRGLRPEGDTIRDWNLRSKGLKDGVGLLRPGREATEGRMLLLGEDKTEPWGLC